MLELGVHVELIGEQKPPIADHEYAEREEQEPPEHEGAHANQSSGRHYPVPSERMNARTRGSDAAIELPGRTTRDDPPFGQQRQLVADRTGARDVVRHDDERGAFLALQLDEQLVDLGGW